jgi:hypothetical protein
MRDKGTNPAAPNNQPCSRQSGNRFVDRHARATILRHQLVLEWYLVVRGPLARKNFCFEIGNNALM